MAITAPPDRYSFPVEACQVDDFESLRRYRRKRAEWEHWLNDDEHHAIWPNLSLLIWNEARFGALSAIADSQIDGALSNSLVTELALYGHVAIQVLAIRRLVDTSKKVVSLRKLLQDVSNNRQLLTRQNFVCFDGLPYDAAAAMEADHAAHGVGVRWLDTTGPNAWGSSNMYHQKFDQLSGVSADKRSRNDRIPKAHFQTIERWISDCGADDIADWSHQYLAHAGSRIDRDRIAGLTMSGSRIDRAIIGLARATEALSADVLNSTGGAGALMPTPQFDQFERLDSPAAGPMALAAGQQRWDELSDRFDGCLDDVREALVKGT